VSGIGNHISKDQLVAWLQSPQLVDVNCIPALEFLITEYPWFAQAHALLALAKKNSGAPDFQTQLHQAALRAPDRRFIYHLLEKKEEKLSVDIPIAPVEIDIEVPADEPIHETIPVENWVDVILEDEPVVVVDEDWVDIKFGEEEEKEVQKEKEKEKEKEEQEQSESVRENEIERASLPESVEFSELGELGQEIMSKAISSSIELEVSEKEEIESQPRNQPTNYDDDFLNFIASSIGELVESGQVDTGWKEPDTQEKQADSIVNPIIEKFIQNEPQINRGKAVEYAAGNMAKESLEEDVNLVTETMAKLYVKQGKLDKARKAYKKLIELYPEKSVYFAGQLKNLNKKN
jgi:tetratricopeptide (TPR) repeat protein